MAKGTAVSGKAMLDAARKADQRELARLASQGGDVNASHRGYRPLHALIQEQPHAECGEASAKRLSCLRWLLEHGANPELTGAWPPARALLITAFQGSRELAEVLRAGGALAGDGFVAAAFGDARTIRRILAKDPDFASARDEGGLTALQCAAASRLDASKTLVVARLLLESGADASAVTRGWDHDLDAAYFAAGSGQRELFELLLDHGVSPTSTLPTLLWKRHFEWAEGALQRGGVLDLAIDQGKPLLNQLIRWGQIEPALWMLSHGANPNLSDERGWTAVHQAASRGNVRILKALLEAGGDPARLDGERRTPWDVAEEMGQLKTMALLPTPR